MDVTQGFYVEEGLSVKLLKCQFEILGCETQTKAFHFRKEYIRSNKGIHVYIKRFNRFTIFYISPRPENNSYKEQSASRPCR